MWVRWQVNRNRVITRNTSGTIDDWVQIFLQCFRGGSYVWSYISDWKRFNFRSFDGCWLSFFWMTSYLLLITLHFFTLFFLQPLAHFAKYFRHTYFANFLHANCCCRRHNNLRNVEQWAVILAYLLNRVLIFFIENFRNISVSDGSGQNFFVYLKTTFHHYKFSVLPTESIFILQGWKQISFKLHDKR